MALNVSDRANLANALNAQREALAADVVEAMYRADFWMLRYGQQGRVTCYNDCLKNLEIFSLALRNGSPMIAENHVGWLRGVYINLGMCTSFLAQSFTHMQTAARNRLDAGTANAFITLLDRCKRALIDAHPIYADIVRHQDAAAEQVVNTLYSAIPYWSVRYGERGRASCKIDTFYNIAFLADALAAKTTKGILIHTRWMRDFLIGRGMTSAYYVDAWAALTETITGFMPANAHAAIGQIYAEIMTAMRHQHPFATLIESQIERIIDAAAAAHYDRSPLLRGLMSRHEYRSDARFKLSYLVDAICTERPAVFTDYIAWVRSVLPQLHFTSDELDAGLRALADALPHGTPSEARDLLSPVGRAVQPQSIELRAKASAVGGEIWNALHHPNALWTAVMGENQRSEWQPLVNAAVAYAADALDTGDLKPTIKWLTTSAAERGGSRAYVLDSLLALRSAAARHVNSSTAAQLSTLIDDGLTTLANDDPALSFLLAPNLIEPILGTLRQYSPYWQVDYQRRSADALASDTRALIGALADDLISGNTTIFTHTIDLQHHALMAQGICTAYYQQMIDLITEAIPAHLDADSAQRATVLLEGANATLESDHPAVLALADAQETVIDFVIGHLRATYPTWVQTYPGGWSDAETDVAYWLAYLSDAVTYNNPAFLSAHVTWLYDLAARRGGDAEPIRVTLIALGHAIKTSLPQHSRILLTIMQAALTRLPTNNR